MLGLVPNPISLAYPVPQKVVLYCPGFQTSEKRNRGLQRFNTLVRVFKVELT